MMMRSQPQLSNDKYIMMQYTDSINSTPSQQQLLSLLAQWLKHSVYNWGVASSSLTIGNDYDAVSDIDVVGYLRLIFPFCLVQFAN